MLHQTEILLRFIAAATFTIGQNIRPLVLPCLIIILP